MRVGRSTGYVDYAFGSPDLIPQVTGVTEYRINSDEPSDLDYNVNYKPPAQILSMYAPDQYRISNHDPVIAGLFTPPTLNVQVTPDVLWPANHDYVTVNATLTPSGG